jgi:hypothetical protein
MFSTPQRQSVHGDTSKNSYEWQENLHNSAVYAEIEKAGDFPAFLSNLHSV